MIHLLHFTVDLRNETLIFKRRHFNFCPKETPYGRLKNMPFRLENNNLNKNFKARQSKYGFNYLFIYYDIIDKVGLSKCSSANCDLVIGSCVETFSVFPEISNSNVPLSRANKICPFDLRTALIKILRRDKVLMHLFIY